MKNLQKKRMAAGLTQEQLGKLLDVEARTIRNWESGRTKIKFAYLDTINRILEEARC